MIHYGHAVKFQHLFWLDKLKTAEYIVDTTCGNGYDTIFLYEHMNNNASLLAIDIQEVAVLKTKEKIKELRNNNTETFKNFSQEEKKIFFRQGDHKEVLKTSGFPWYDLVVFNLGYLPGGDHTFHTKGVNTCKAIETALLKIKSGGLLTLVAYPGTEEGRDEQLRVEMFLSSLPQASWDVSCWQPINQINYPPILYIVKGR